MGTQICPHTTRGFPNVSQATIKEVLTCHMMKGMNILQGNHQMGNHLMEGVSFFKNVRFLHKGQLNQMRNGRINKILQNKVKLMSYQND